MADGESQGKCGLQKEDITNFLKTPLRKGDTWYLIDTKWFKQWKKYVGFDNWDTSYVGDQSANPGPIDNSPLLKEGTKDQLKEHLIDELDYNLVPAEGWQKLVEWYEIVEGQEPIARKVIEQGMFVKHCKVEVYLMDLKLCQNSEIDNHVLKQFSRADTIDSIEKEMRRVFSISEDTDVRLWNKYLSNTYEHLNKPDNTVQDAGLYQGQVIVIEKKNEDGSWPRQSKSTNSAIHSNTLEIDSCTSASAKATTSSGSSSYSNSGYGGGSYSSYGSYDGYRSSAAPGLCGLSNLGNTCFMNSAIQCMSNVSFLTEYFLAGQWKEELNLDNPLGMKGEIASSYAELIRNMWSGKYSYTVPRNFKISVGRFAPQFSGYQQQDSQELMAFLLDGLHEDLNRIKKKPYIELKDADGRQDEEVAKEAWTNYLRRNDSVIVDIFHGLLKSTLVCPECSKVSVTFDPFCYLSLPLPVKKERQIEVFLVPLDPMRKTVHYKLTVPKLGCVSDLCKALSRLTNIPPDKMVVTDVYNHKFHKVFSNDEALSHILDRDDIFIYEVPVSSGEDPDTIIVPIYMKEKKIRHGYSNYPQQSTTQLFGQPMLVATSRHNTSSDMLYNCILNRMVRFTKKPDDNEEWWKTPAKDKQENVTVNGEAEMSREEEQESPDESNNVSEEGDDINEDDIVNEADRKPPRLFTFTCVNSYGNAEVDAIKDDGKPIRFSNRTYIAIEWHPRAKEQFYDEKAAELIETHDSVNIRPMQKKQVIQLSECLELFTTTEKLGEQDPWYCPRCKKHQQATKKFDLWDLPRVLVIHLKRFSYNRYWRDKLDTFVEYPTKGLNMKQYVINHNHSPALYDLIAVSNHYGGMGGGHYTAYAKNKEDGQWYHFDDSSVSQCSEDSVVTKAGYVLVYQRRDQGSSDMHNGRQASGAATSPDSDEMMATTNGEHSSEDEMDVN